MVGQVDLTYVYARINQDYLTLHDKLQPVYKSLIDKDDINLVFSKPTLVKPVLFQLTEGNVNGVNKNKLSLAMHVCLLAILLAGCSSVLSSLGYPGYHLKTQTLKNPILRHLIFGD